MQKLITKLRSKGIMALSVENIIFMIIFGVIMIAIGSQIMAGIEDATDNNNTTAIIQTGQGILADSLTWIGIIVIVAFAVIIFIWLRYARGAGEEGGGR